MSSFSIRRTHALKAHEVHERVSHAAEKLSQRFGAKCRWEGERLVIEHPNVHGTVRVTRHEVVVEAKLGFALALFRSRVEGEITRILDRELEA